LSEVVSLIIPVFNGERFLREAIESALEQTRPPHEVIVVDDGSTDASAEIARSLGVTCLQQSNQGPSAARNLGAAHSSGDYIAFLDQDDVWLPRKLAAQLEALAEEPDAAYALCYVRYLLEDEASPPDWFHRRGAPEGEPGYSPCCWLLRRSAWDAVGPMRTDRRYTQDVDWMSRAKDLGLRPTMVPETLALKRIHGANLMGEKIEATKREFLVTLRDSVLRKRAADEAT
jgi:glycosyltransferase involved in cell wall biosynthesis